ncbi:hypothetical protein HGRIS_006761 [Hohenbuehelia grisea]|uniref:NADH:flavin oxidoreductase/NADH oxidase N-terminal domain-containing protein n=1 Tax=Hohenbuehelia grisea TaxID=104357 RepID=A0ABR3JAJ3_9AGAR
MSEPLFQPIRVGNMELQHRVVHPPLTRFRCNKHSVPLPIVKEYYGQRASTPGTLVIGEATLVSPQAGGYPNLPGIWSDAQIAAWKEIVDVVHAKGSYMVLQLWAIGRAANAEFMKHRKLPFVSASDIPVPDSELSGAERPRALTITEIKEYVRWYTAAALNGITKAGFDAVEVPCGNGYLVHQFLSETSNQRMDEYGGSIENRCRFALEIIDSVVEAIGPEKTGVRMSPWAVAHDIRMADPVPTHAYLVEQLQKRHPNLAYLQLVEPRVDVTQDRDAPEEESNDFIKQRWNGIIINSGGHDRASGLQIARQPNQLVAYGRHFIANPDLPRRLKDNLPLNKYDRKTFYVYGSASPEGYIDYPFIDGNVTLARL